MPSPRIRPGRYVSIDVSRSSLPSATSCRIVAATKVLVMLAARTWVCGANPARVVDVGVPGRESGYVGAVPDDGDATGQLVAGDDLAQRVVDAGGGLRVRAGAAQCDDEENGTDDRDAH
jgi:hypothetical protein